MTTVCNVLVFPCGSEPGTEIYFALRRSLHVKLFGASSVDDHGRFVFEHYIGDLPRITDAGFERAFQDLIDTHRIDVIFSTHDTVSCHLAGLAARSGVHLVNGNATTATICRSKHRTYDVLQDAAWLPRRYAPGSAAIDFPVIVKPDTGQGGQGVQLVHNRDELDAVTRADPDSWVIVEYLPGDEITVDCFTDWQRELIWAGARSRERVKAGISMRSAFLGADATVQAIAADINRHIEMRGPWFFQLKKDVSGAWKLLEVSCRIAGTMVAHRAKGINLPLMAIQDFMARKQTTLPITEVTLVDRRLASTAQFDYPFDTVVLDYDDTLVCSKTGRAFPEVIGFLYTMIELEKRIVLVTRHPGDLVESFAGAHICASLFTEIVHLKGGERKSDHVGPRAIFVDNHFPERKEVAERCACPVFDVDTLGLIHWR